MTALPPVEIVDYNSEWPVTFDALCTRYQRTLGSLACAIEHVGSTSVPGLAAKPILDIDIVIASRADLPAVIDVLSTLGYTHQGDQGISGREAFRRDSKLAPYNSTGREWPGHHLYVCVQDSVPLHEHLIFRNHLRSSPADVHAYSALKRELAQRFRYDREAYTEAKTDFIRGILSKYPNHLNLPG